MDFRRPLLSVTPTLDGDVLAALSRGELELTGRELWRRVGHGSPEGIRRAADRLVSQGTVTRRAAGAAHLYSLNREHLAAPYIEALAGVREELIERLRERTAGWEQPPLIAMLFGSAARGTATGESDLDILVIRPRGLDPDSDPWRGQLLTLQRAATAWTGNDTRLVEYGEEELSELGVEPLLGDVLDHGIELHGTRRQFKRLIRPASAA